MHKDPALPQFDLSKLKVACSNCTLFELCLPVGIAESDLNLLEHIIKPRRPVQRSEYLFQMGQKFESIYAIRSGSVKTYTLTEDGREQVTGFHLAGELVGLDAISSEYHSCTAKALETTSVCELPYGQLEDLWSRIPSLPRQLLRIMSKEVLHDQSLMTLLGKKSAEERLASYLLSLSTRLGQRGFSPNEFNLSMSRNDIGNYLGLAVETVSRLFTRFQDQKILTVQRRNVRIHDLGALRRIASFADIPQFSPPAP